MKFRWSPGMTTLNNLKHEFINANGIKIHYVTAGKGPLVILLHGFPEFWYTWRHQIPFLSEHFQVVAPDLRGYGDTEKPSHVSDYQPSIIANDIVELIHALGHDKASIVGHDWGGGIGWRIAIDHPEVVDRLIVLNCPHPVIFNRALTSNFQQIKRSWYVFFFLIPYIPELVFKIRSKQMIKEIFRGSVIRKTTFSDEDIDKYYQALAKPGAFTAALNYYRAAFLKRSRGSKSEGSNKKISSPTLLIWGEEDKALGKELTYGMESLFTGPFTIEYIPNCSHWVNEEQPERVNQLLLQFLTKT